MDKFWKSGIWKYLIAFLLPVLMVLIMAPDLDNDSWYVLAEGRQIVEHGVYHTDELSMHEGLEVTVQNYGFAAIFYLIYSVCGATGIYLAMLALCMIMLYLLYKICMLVSEGNENLSLILMAITGVVLSVGFLVTRAQVVDYVVILALVYALELYIKKGKWKYLGLVPLLSLIEINLHASSWWMLFLIIGFYLIDGIKKPKLHLQGYNWKLILMVMLIAMGVGLINPYGVKMITMIFTSYGEMANLGLVNELQPFMPFSGHNLVYFLAIVLVVWMYALGEKRNVRIRYLLMFAVFLLVGLNTVKGMSELMLTMFFPLVLVYKDWRIPRLIDSKKIGRMVTSGVGIVITSLVIGLVLTIPWRVEDAPRKPLAEAVEVMDMEVANMGVSKKDLKVYTGYDDGGYLEFRGYKPYLDPRGEVFLKKNNGKEDIIKEWIDLREGVLSREDFLGRYDFDFLVVRSGDKLYEVEDGRYELLYDNGNHGDRIYKKVDIGE